MSKSDNVDQEESFTHKEDDVEYKEHELCTTRAA